MMAIKFAFALFLFIVSTCVNAVIIDGSFNAQVVFDQSDEGMWSRDLRGSEVTGKFWYDTELGPTPESGFPHNPYLYNYESETNPWINLILFIDGKTIDMSKLAGLGQDVYSMAEHLLIDTNTNEFRIYKGITTRDSGGGFHTTSASTWIYSPDDYSELYFDIYGSINEDNRYASHLEMAITDYSISTREVSVPEPSSLALILISLLVFVLAHKKKHLRKVNLI
ncbi:MAG: PEP-CTERM sorting domain-containing protein [Pseudomonadota bacterium]